MNYNVRHPSEVLRPFVKLYWEMNGLVGDDSGHIQRIIPTGMPDMIFYFDDIPENIVREQSEKSRSVMNGQQTGYFDLKVRGTISLFSVSFTPHGTRQFFNIPASELHNMNLPLRILVGRLADEIEERLFHARNINSRIAVIEEFLVNRLSLFYKHEFKRMEKTVNAISLSRGICNLNDLSGTACLSRRQFERSFSDHIGLTPKQFLRVVRFQNAIDNKRRSPDSSLTQIAHNSGYSDQAHMVREFQRLSGLTPGKYFASCEPVSDYFI